ncbi:hypothetical protein IE4771_PB00107 (plasmid) [Rhizobium etli bv. mimosae str. IE4771]|uniref:Uncharacterized protein n=1 Tax=Rhizobium etli bv. mimosae str. IE4771 TaxID=1432050 RepID=A0A060I3V8_RHIET|nr:hypothetical protein IE4771_PB00107 [Rhizobium sp. IE4771]
MDVAGLHENKSNQIGAEAFTQHTEISILPRVVAIPRWHMSRIAYCQSNLGTCSFKNLEG